MRIPTQEETDELKKEVVKDVYAPDEMLSIIWHRRKVREAQRRLWGRPS